VLLEPSFPADEFAKLKNQTVARLIEALANPSTVAGRELTKAIYADSALGHQGTPETVGKVTLQDVKDFHAKTYLANDAILTIAGDITVERGQQLANQLLEGWAKGEQPKVDYTLPKYPGRKVILIDNPNGKQSVVRIGLPSYTIHTDDKFAGMVAGQILSAGIDSRLGRYVRAEKGYVYGIAAYFSPGRYGGSFGGQTETGFKTTAETVDAFFKVFNDMRSEPVKPTELAEAKSRVAGGMLMDTQTIEQQRDRRVDAILNNYPIDYWDKLPSRVAEVTAEQVQAVMNKYVKDDAMTIIVIAPAKEVKEQLEKFGKVEILPMPSDRTAATRPSSEMLK
jgi:predicted Zn-dependent peptidase